MEPKAETTPPELLLPVMVVGPSDISHLERELESLDGSLLQLSLRAGGEPVSLPRTSHLMAQVIELNKINILLPEHRQALQAAFEKVRTTTPILHMSFSADPTAAFIEQLMTWLRREIHPRVLLTVGLQPNIGAGCIVRSTNKYFDCSLRQDFASKRTLLLEKLATAVMPVTSTPPQPIATEGGSLT